MLAQVGVNRFDFIYINTAASTAPGTSVIPGASNVEGSWTSLATSGNIAKDIYLLTIWVSGGSNSGQIKEHLLDIGIDPAGTTAYIEVFANIVCGSSAAALAGGGLFLILPLFIKSGSSIAARIQGSNSTAGTVRVLLTAYGVPSRPELVRVGQYAEAVGTITNSAGVAFTPGNSGAEGTWVSLGTLARSCWWFQLCVQCSNSAMTAVAHQFDLAYGDSSNKTIIVQDLFCENSGSEATSFTPRSSQINGYADLPAGTELWVRGTSSGTADTGWSAVAIGIGG